jgi:hypothetical protein
MVFYMESDKDWLLKEGVFYDEIPNISNELDHCMKVEIEKMQRRELYSTLALKVMKSIITSFKNNKRHISGKMYYSPSFEKPVVFLGICDEYCEPEISDDGLCFLYSSLIHYKIFINNEVKNIPFKRINLCYHYNEAKPPVPKVEMSFFPLSRLDEL